jgi:hypothetical protein
MDEHPLNPLKERVRRVKESRVIKKEREKMVGDCMSGMMVDRFNLSG